MPKTINKKTIYVCKNCGYESTKWLGKCPVCNEWDTFTEFKYDKNINIDNNLLLNNSVKEPKSINEIEDINNEKISSGLKEFDRLIGGGIVLGSLVLLGGAPGIGKSTLLLQIAKNLSDDNKKVLYISGEENLSQIKIRAKRIGKFNENVKFLDEVELEKIRLTVSNFNPDLLIIDSIQTLVSNDSTEKIAGSISQIKTCANGIFRLCKELNIATFLIGHITKDGLVAGPKILEHMVDTVLYFEDDNLKTYRVLRCIKNRFGSNRELAVFEMKSDGLKEVSNPSEIFLDGRPTGASGCVVTCTIDSNRPIFLEVQSLVTQSNYGMAKRTISGSDYNRLSLLIAIIEKRLNIPLFQYDIYINITGGLKIHDTSIDLAIIMAIISSYKNKALGNDCVYCGEVGLSGELRSIPNAEMIIKEAIHLGYKKLFLPKVNIDNINVHNYNKNIELKSIANVMQ